jgi:hypothetical protein
MADRMRVTSLMASARAQEKVGWCRFYPPAIAVAILPLLGIFLTMAVENVQPP